MFQLHEKSALAVAASSRAAVMDLDTAYVKQLRLAADAVETIQGAGIPAGQSQRLMRSFQSGFGKLVEGRSELVSAIGQLQVMQKHSNIAEVDLGCNGPWEIFFTTGQAQDGEAAQLASETV